MSYNKSKLTILFIAPIVKGSITEQRINSLKTNNCIVIPFDIQPYYEKFDNPIKRRLAFKYNFPFMLRQINEKVKEFAKEIDYDIAFVNKGIVFSPQTIEVLREESRKHFVLHYSADPTLITHKTRYFTNSISKYDLCVSTKGYEKDLYPKHKPKELLIIDQGYDNRFIQVANDYNHPRNYKFDVVFIGRAEEHYINALRAVLSVTKNVAIWGPWDKAIKNNQDLKPYWKGSSVFGDDYIHKLREGKICLGLLCKIHPDQSTTRSFEIPASGSFLLAERTEDHERLFIDKKEAAFFDTYNDLKKKVQFYLEHEDKRKEIEQAGFAKCISAGYSNNDRVREILDVVRSRIVEN